MWGNASERVAVVTAKARSLPALMDSIDEDTETNIACTWPPRRAVTISPPLRYGTCCILIPVILLNSSPAIWGEDPMPPEAMSILPAWAWGRRRTAESALVGTEGLAIRLRGQR